MITKDGLLIKGPWESFAKDTDDQRCPDYEAFCRWLSIELDDSRIREKIDLAKLYNLFRQDNRVQLIPEWNDGDWQQASVER